MEGKPVRQENAAASDANAFATLRRFARKPQPEEKCELCSAALGPEHPHLVELLARKLVCACDACALLFDSAAVRKYKRVPRRLQLLESFRITDLQWDRLLLPINMAFFFLSSIDGKVIALYPSPAGAVESLLSLDSWNEIVRENPQLDGMEADVEALLVNRVGHVRGSAPAEYYIAPIDECYKLVGLIRSHWRGLSGGTEVWQEIARFFTELRQKASGIEPGS
jgi:Family of unknown function (DUF5947)